MPTKGEKIRLTYKVKHNIMIYTEKTANNFLNAGMDKHVNAKKRKV